MEKLLDDLDDNVELVEFEEDCDHYKVIKNGEGDDDKDAVDDSNATIICENTISRPPVSAKAEPDAEPPNVISLISDDEDEEEQQQPARENVGNKRTNTEDNPQTTNDPKRPRQDNAPSTSNETSNFVPDNVLEEILAATNQTTPETSPTTNNQNRSRQDGDSTSTIRDSRFVSDNVLEEILAATYGSFWNNNYYRA